MRQPEEINGVPIYRYVEAEPSPPAGVLRAWQVLHTGKPGPGSAREVALLLDEDGGSVLEPVSDWQPVTITDD